MALNDGLAAMMFSSDYERAIAISLPIIDRFGINDFPYLIASHLTLVGRCYVFLTQYDTARDYLHRAETIAFETSDTSDDLMALRSEILHDTAMNEYHSGGRPELILGHLERAIEVLRGRFPMRRAVCIMGMGNVLYDAEKLDDALDHYLRASVIMEESPESYPNLSAIYSNIGMCYTALDRFSEAEPYLMRALDIRTRIGSYAEIANSYYNISLFHKKQNDSDRAYESLITSRDYAMIGNARGIQILVLTELEAMARERGDLDAAEQYHGQILSINDALA
jgi:tetratricopeptide (TPR) repeat protein